MAVSQAPSMRRAPGRAGRSRPGRRLARWAAGVLLTAGALLAVASPALAAAHAASGPPVSRTTGSAAAAAARIPVQLTAEVTPAAPGGVCQVPGIGDIGGLVGLCSSGSAGIVGDLNNICEPSLPQPEQATGGIDAMIEPPAGSSGGKTLYDNYGIAGQFWAAHGLQCSDMTSLVGNNVAGMVFDGAKSLDRVTITVYQSAAGSSILTWLQNAVDKLISALGNAIYFPYLAPVVILGAMWLAWQGLIRKRATRTIEGTLWMVVAAVAAIALIGQADFTGIGTTVSNGVTGVLNTAFSKLPAPAGSNCLPVAAGDPQSVTASYAFTSGNGLVDQNANELWSVLVCKPWVWGELGTTGFAATGSGAPTVVNTYGRQLLWSQAIAANESPTTALIQAKQATYTGIASALQTGDPAIYPLFQGNQWTTRLEIAFAAMFAAVVAGLLILLIALTLIVLKLGFLLLLVAGPLFLIIGTHPGFGRIIAIRWFEMLAGVLMKQVAIAITLSVLLYCYSLIMGTANTVLPWALKILMIALVTVAVFIYRKPFTHLFSAVGYGSIGSHERAEYSLREAGSTFRRSTRDAATVAIPGIATYRAARWARRNPGSAAPAGTGTMDAGVAAGTAAAPVGTATGTATGTGQVAASTSRFRPDAPPAADGDGEGATGARRLTGAGVSVRSMPETDGSGRTAPPLDLPPRTGTSGSAGSSSAASSWSRGAGRSAGSNGLQRTRSRAPSPASSGPAAPRSAAAPRPAAAPKPAAPAPAWPSTGWSGAGPRQRSAIAPKPTPSPAPPASRQPAAARPTETVRKNSHPCRSGSVRYGGTSSGRSLWISALASATRSSPSSSWCLPCLATSWWCRRSPIRTGRRRRRPRRARRRPP